MVVTRNKTLATDRSRYCSEDRIVLCDFVHLVITRAVRHGVSKWAGFFPFFFSYLISFWGIDFRSYADWLACCQYVINVICHLAKNEIWAREVCFACLTWLYGLLVRTLISLTNAYTGCGRPTLNFIERFVSVPTAKPLHLVSVGR